MPVVRHLVVSEYGAFLGKHHGRLRVSRDGAVLVEAPLLHLEEVLILGTGVALSADAVEACCTAGIPIYFLDPAGRPYAALCSAGLTGTVLTRREQLLAYRDRRGVELAVAFARGKITNQAGFLRYAAKYREETAPEVGRHLKQEAERVQDGLEELRHLRGDTVEEVRGQILSIEGRAAQRYWEALRAVVPESYGWPGRQTRGARDPVNAALNYGYGILYGQVERALVLAGLDPYGGFIHADRPGKPSLVFDLIEEFRTVVVDRTVVGMVTKGMKLEMEEGRLAHQEARERERRRTLRIYGLEEARRHYDVWVASEELGLQGRIDLVLEIVAPDVPRRAAQERACADVPCGGEEDGFPAQEWIPVDYKQTARRAGSHLRRQLTAYGMMLEETWGGVVRRGFIYSLLTRRVEEVMLTSALRQEVRETVAAMQEMVERERMPDPPRSRKPCVHCEFRRFCNDVG